MPHNLVTLCLCYANQTSSEVPISSSNQDTARLGRGDRILLPSVIPARCRVVITQREALLRSGIRSDANAARRVVEPVGDTTPFGHSIHRPDAARNLELANAEFRTTADADQVPESM